MQYLGIDWGTRKAGGARCMSAVSWSKGWSLRTRPGWRGWYTRSARLSLSVVVRGNVLFKVRDRDRSGDDGVTEGPVCRHGACP